MKKWNLCFDCGNLCYKMTLRCPQVSHLVAIDLTDYYSQKPGKRLSVISLIQSFYLLRDALYRQLAWI